MRVVIADDSVLVREGIAAILTRAGIEVLSQVDSPDDLLREVDALIDGGMLRSTGGRFPKLALTARAA